jgi:hypothetical protein
MLSWSVTCIASLLLSTKRFYFWRQDLESSYRISMVLDSADTVTTFHVRATVEYGILFTPSTYRAVYRTDYH